MSTTPASRVFLASWLDKKMDWRFVYEHRYFILDGTRLSYRLEEHGAEKRFGTITSFEPYRDSDHEENAKGYCFTVWLMEGGCWGLRAATREIYDSWYRAILTVLVPSANPSATPSETGGGGGGGPLHSRSASSVTDGSAPHSGIPSTNYLEGEGLGLGAAVGGGGANGRSGTPARRAAAADSGLSGGNTPARPGDNNEAVSSADTSSLTGAALAAAAHRPTTPVSSPDALLLSSMIEKERAWRGQWKARYMELREGRLLILRSSATSSTERQRYVLEAVDPSPHAVHATWMLISTSSGDRFWVRFGSYEERQRWLMVCRRLLMAECTWRWMPLAEDDAGRTWRLRQATSGAYDDLRLHYHCATVVPSFSDEVWCPSLFVFGGSDRWCRPLFNPQARAFLPHADAAHTNGRLAAMELAGPHMVRALQPAPFKEGPHALVRPLARYGATLTCLPVAAGRRSASATEGGGGGTAGHDGAVSLGARVVLLGGLTGGGYQPPATELWHVWRSKAACAPGMEVRWGRHDLPSYELPSLAFHDAVYVPWSADAAEGKRHGGRQQQPHDGFMLVTGGLDVEYRCRSECYAVVWNPAAHGSSSTNSATGGDASPSAEDAEERAYRTAPAAYAFGQLPGPRAFHRTAVLADGTVVLVGGRGVENAPAGSTVLTLAPEVWRRAAKTWWGQAEAASDAAQPAPPQQPQESENWCSISSEDDAPHRVEGEDGDGPSSHWLRAPFDTTPGASTSTAQQLVAALPADMGDVAVSATDGGSRVVVMGQVSQPRQDVKLYLLDFTPVTMAAQKISAGEQFPAGTRRVRCHEVVLFVGAVPNRVVGITIHVFNGYLYVLGGCTVDKSKTESYDLCCPLRILLE